MEDIVYGLAATVCQLPHSTLLDVHRLLFDPLFRRTALGRISTRADPIVLEFWQGWEKLSEAQKRERADPVLYRFRRFYRSAPVRNRCPPRRLVMKAPSAANTR